MMLCTSGDESILNDTRFIFEPKLDGFRALFENGNFTSRNGKNLNHLFSGKIDRKNITLDGELVKFDENGNPDFSKINEGDTHFVVFDVLKLDGKDLKKLPLIKRKEILGSNIKKNKRVEIMFFTENGKNLFDEMKKRGLEGLIAKKKNSTYIDGRSKNWLKLKFTKTIDVIVLSYTEKSSAAIGVYKNNQITEIGHVSIDKKKVFPGAVIEVRFTEITSDNKLRHPVFMKIREDKNPKECVL